MAYRSIEERDAGRKSMFEKAASDGAALKAQQMIDEDAESISREQDILERIAAAEEKGIATGSRAGATDATRSFVNQGFVPPQFAQMANKWNQAGIAEDLAREGGLGMQQEAIDGAAQAQIENISGKLLEASIQGAPEEQINQAISQLNVPNSIKQQAAKLFVQKRQDIGSTGQAPQQSTRLPGSAVDRMNSPITKQAQGIIGDTDRRVAELREKLNGGGQPQQ